MSVEFKPHAYQAYCIDKIVSNNNVGLFLDMGLGKTAITLSAIKELKYYRLQVRKALVIAPKKVAEGTWVQEAEKWAHTECLKVIEVLGSKQKRIDALKTDGDIYVTNRENVAWLVDLYKNDWPFDMVVIDESSSFKNHEAKRFKALKSALPKISRVVELTGTPSPNSLMDLWSQVYLLDEGNRLEKSFYGFRSRYFNPGQRGPNNVVFNYNPKPGAYGAILKRIDDICVSMKSEDYLTLPDMVMQENKVLLDTKANKQYRELERELILEMDDTDEDIAVTSAAALSNKLLQLSNGAIYDENGVWHEIHDCKLQALTELIEALNGSPVLVFYSYKHDLERIKQKLKRIKDIKVRELKTVEDQYAWNKGEVDVLLAHPASAAYGLNLQAGGNHIIWFGLTWNYEQYAQANKRLHRQGQKHTVFIHHLVCKETRDEDVMKALNMKEKAQDFVLESLKARIRKYRG